MHAYIVIGLVVALCLYLKKKHKLLCTLFVVVAICLGTFVDIAIVKPELLEPFKEKGIIQVEDGEKIEVGSGMFCLSSGSAPSLVKEFVFVDDSNLDDIRTYLRGTSKNVHLYVKSGEDLIYSKNLGLLNEDDAESIMSIYKTYKEDGLLPRPKVRYKFLFLYYDV